MRGRRMLPFLLALVIIVGVAIGAGDPAQGQTPKRGGVLTSMIIEDLSS